MTKGIKTAAILGRGALGVMFGDFLTRKLGKDNVYFLADEKRISRYANEKITCNGKACNFCYKTPESVDKPADLLLVSVKGTQLEKAIRDSAKAIGDDQIIISSLNGISSEEIIEKTLGRGKIIDCVAQKMDALFLQGRLTYKDFGELCIGLSAKNKVKRQYLQTLVKFFDSIHFPYMLEQNIEHRMWCKWMLNVGVNQTLAVYDSTFSLIQKEGEPRDVMVLAMREVVDLSRKEGINLTEEDFKTYLQIIDNLNPQGMPSMRQDRIAKRPTEVKLFAGTVIEKARKWNLPVPVNTMLAEKIAEFERTYK